MDYAFDLLFLDGATCVIVRLPNAESCWLGCLKKAPRNIRFSEELHGTREELLQVAHQFPTFPSGLTQAVQRHGSRKHHRFSGHLKNI